jgi:hypothetical protein
LMAGILNKCIYLRHFHPRFDVLSAKPRDRTLTDHAMCTELQCLAYESQITGLRPRHVSQAPSTAIVVTCMPIRKNYIQSYYKGHIQFLGYARVAVDWIKPT